MDSLSVVSLIYHEVAFEGIKNFQKSYGCLESKYVLNEIEFKKHVDILSGLVSSAEPVGSLQELNRIDTNTAAFITIDDGYSSIVDIAQILESKGLKGFFFIIGDRIGLEGYAREEDLRRLRTKGHRIGTHSFSHPQNISQLNYNEIVAEWKKGIEVLQEILGEKVLTAGVPGGFTSKNVVRAAAEAGIEILFTSEPVTRVKYLPNIAIFGRYNIPANMDSNYVAALVRGSIYKRFKQFLQWNVKKIIKFILGRHFNKIKSILYSHY